MDLNSTLNIRHQLSFGGQSARRLFSTHSLSSSLISGCEIVFRISLLRSGTYGSQEHTRGAISKG